MYFLYVQLKYDCDFGFNFIVSAPVQHAMTILSPLSYLLLAPGLYYKHIYMTSTTGRLDLQIRVQHFPEISWTWTEFVLKLHDEGTSFLFVVMKWDSELMIWK